eukprot:PhM_4_TR16361/c0_g1_i1/m.33283
MRRTSQSNMSNAQQQQQVVRHSIPTVVARISCRLNIVATFTVKIDPKMTTEQLKENIWSQYNHHVNGLKGSNAVPSDFTLSNPKYKPLSDNPHDYDLQVVNQGDFTSGKATSNNFFAESRFGGALLRSQLMQYPRPCYAVMVIGRHWKQRDGMCQQETEDRVSVIETQEALLRSVIQDELGVASKNKMLALEEHRVKAELVSKRVEALMVKCAVLEIERQREVVRARQKFDGLMSEWRCVMRQREDDGEKLTQKKRIMVTEYRLFRLGDNIVEGEKKV